MADCKDDGHRFTVADRLDVIDRMLQGSQWQCINRGELSHVYSRRNLKQDDSVVILSSHVDCVYESFFIEHQTGDSVRGTFDNALTNTAVVELMLSGRLPENVIVAFNGDEELESRGARSLLNFIAEKDCYVRFVLVTDVTNVGWDLGLSFTIENDQNIDLLTAHAIVCAMKKFAGKCGFEHDALPDESWVYNEYRLPCLTLSHSVGGDMHSDEGAVARLSSFPVYCDALADLCNLFRE